MVRDFWILSILLVLAGIAVQADLPEGKNWVNNVSRVVDGETIVVMHDGEPETVRLFGVDCPDDGQPFADEARTYTAVLVLRKSVDVHPVGKDTSGRTVAWVFQKGKNVNHLLVEAGLAWWSRQDAPSDRKLQELERQARAGRRRMWVQDNPVAPWDYRQELMKKKKTGPEDTVYVTRVDSTYHRAGCPLLHRSIINLLSTIPMALPDAKVKYKPCPVCDPPR